MQYCFVDLETTGLDVSKDWVIEIGTIGTDADLNILFTFESRIKPLKKIEKETEAFRIHGISSSDLELAPGYQKVVAQIQMLFEKYFSDKPVLVSDCLNFEWGFLSKLFAGQPWPFHYCGRDVGILNDFLGVEFRLSHSALADAFDCLSVCRLAQDKFLRSKEK